MVKVEVITFYELITESALILAFGRACFYSNLLPFSTFVQYFRILRVFNRGVATFYSRTVSQTKESANLFHSIQRLTEWLKKTKKKDAGGNA